MDCKILVDTNAQYRQEDLFKLQDRSQEDELEMRAAAAHLNYIRLEGDIGCLGVFFISFLYIKGTPSFNSTIHLMR